MIKIGRYALICSLFGIIYSCYPLNKEIKTLDLVDLSKSQQGSVFADLKEEQYVYKVSIQVAGEANGSFEINNIPFNSGKIDSLISNIDWYQMEYPIKFNPITCNEGNLSVKVTFFIQT